MCGNGQFFKRLINILLYFLLTACGGGSEEGPSESKPELGDLPTQTFVKNKTIDVVTFPNSGIGKLTSCETDSFPSGLLLTVSDDLKTCEITGTPNSEQQRFIYTVRATSDAGIFNASVAIIVNAPAPLLLDEPIITYFQGQPINPFLFRNQGGGSLNICSAINLPKGLEINVSENRQSCELSGTPSEVQLAEEFTITAANITASTTSNIIIRINPIAPVLENSISLTFTQHEAITDLRLINSGGGLLSSCSADSLPSGLNLNVTNDASSCVINGTPLNSQSENIYAIIATNISGSSTSQLLLRVNPAAPQLENISAQTFTQNSSISSLILNNSGGRISECLASSLPSGLFVNVTSNGTACEIIGAPTEDKSSTNYLIKASNITGESSSVITITVNPVSPNFLDLSEYTFLVGEDIIPIQFMNNGGGKLLSCLSNNLPNGLLIDISQDGYTCRISGTPLSIQPEMTHQISATNITGTGNAEVRIRVNPAGPVLEDMQAQLFVVNSEINT